MTKKTILAPMAPFLLSLTSEEFSSLGRRIFCDRRGEARGSGIAPGIYGRYFRMGTWSLDPGLSSEAIEIWGTVCSPESPLVLETVETDPGDSAASKALFRLADGPGIETVLVPMDSPGGGRGTLCLSSQAGCAMGCAFCETGRGGLERNLTVAEIVAQVFEARFRLGWEFSHLVFMGMGEPLANLDALIPALRVLTDPRGFAFGQDKITVCTVGLVDGIRRLGELGWKRLGLSVSLNSARPVEREALMPVTRSNPLARLKAALQDYPKRKNFMLALNYCLIPGRNDAEADAQSVAAFAGGLGRVLVNLIPYNPGTHPVGEAPRPDEIEVFLGRLRATGLEVRLRGPKGRSIRAACGQLGARREAHGA